jgi:hypothetical protein
LIGEAFQKNGPYRIRDAGGRSSRKPGKSNAMTLQSPSNDDDPAKRRNQDHDCAAQNKSHFPVAH